jgi:hypothetical protein
MYIKNKKYALKNNLLLSFLVFNPMVVYVDGHALSTIPCFQLTSSVPYSLTVQHRTPFSWQIMFSDILGCLQICLLLFYKLVNFRISICDQSCSICPMSLFDSFEYLFLFINLFHIYFEYDFVGTVVSPTHSQFTIRSLIQ